jgi:hypothetical protein
LASCRTFVKQDTVLGIPTVVISQPFKPNRIHRMWLAPSLVCATVRHEYLTFDTDGKTVEKVVVEPDQIIQAEPDPKLFTANFDELKPSAVHQRRSEYFKKAHLPSTEREIKNLERQDKAYENTRAEAAARAIAGR